MSMPKAKMRSMRGSYSVGITEQSIAPKHTHFYHGGACPVLVSEKGVCNNNCLDACPSHGSNCKIGFCLSCWLYEGKKTIHHFLPLPPKNRRKRKQKV